MLASLLKSLALEVYMHKSIYFLIFLMTFSVAYAKSEDAAVALKLHLNDGIVFNSNKEIMFCPDQKCKVFRAKIVSSDLASFVYLYLYHSKDYISLAEYLKKRRVFRNKAVEESTIRHANAHYCAEKNITPQCILEGMKRSLGIVICSANHDQGKLCINCGGTVSCNKHKS